MPPRKTTRNGASSMSKQNNDDRSLSSQQNSSVTVYPCGLPGGSVGMGRSLNYDQNNLNPASQYTMGDFGELIPPKHAHIPSIPVENEISYYILITLIAYSATAMQYLHLYRTAWWLPQSHAKYAVNFHLIDVHLVGFLGAMEAIPLMLFFFQRLFIMNRKKFRFILMLLGFLCLITLWLLCFVFFSVHVYRHTSSFYLILLVYPFLTYAVVYYGHIPSMLLEHLARRFWYFLTKFNVEWLTNHHHHHQQQQQHQHLNNNASSSTNNSSNSNSLTTTTNLPSTDNLNHATSSNSSSHPSSPSSRSSSRPVLSASASPSRSFSPTTNNSSTNTIIKEDQLTYSPLSNNNIVTNPTMTTTTAAATTTTTSSRNSNNILDESKNNNGQVVSGTNDESVSNSNSSSSLNVRSRLLKCFQYFRPGSIVGASAGSAINTNDSSAGLVNSNVVVVGGVAVAAGASVAGSGSFSFTKSYHKSLPIVHNCTNNPEKVREEAEILKADFNHRSRDILFTTLFITFHSTVVPILFVSNSIHYDGPWCTQHLCLTALCTFLTAAVHYLPPTYIDLMHRCALHLGKWCREENRVAHTPYTAWSELQLFPQGTLVKHVRGLFRSVGVLNSAEPGNSMHARFHMLFYRPLFVVNFLCVAVFCALGIQFFLLAYSYEWYKLISVALMMFFNFASLYKLLRNRILLGRCYKEENSHMNHQHHD